MTFPAFKITGMTFEPVQHLDLTGRLFFEEGVYACHLHEIGQVTWNKSRDAVIDDISRLVKEYFDSYVKLGLYAARLEQLGLKPAPMFHYHISIKDETRKVNARFEILDEQFQCQAA